MHLLVPGAYRRLVGPMPVLPMLSQCTFWCRVLTDSERAPTERDQSGSQCTFWCRVLTDANARFALAAPFIGLNAPSGAGCLPTQRRRHCSGRSRGSQCTFWCRVLTDQNNGTSYYSDKLTSQCTFWCRVLTDSTSCGERSLTTSSQCTFWCRVLTDMMMPAWWILNLGVSMHLLVPGAYRLRLPTRVPGGRLVSMHLLVPGAYRLG